MIRIILLSIVLLSFNACVSSSSEPEDKEAILSVLKTQEKAWNNYDIEGFMEGYWKSDSLEFYGATGVTSGWNNILDNYHGRYPSKAHTGKLNFVINSMSRIDAVSYYVMGEYHLKREVGDANGIFMIIFKKINGVWKIIADTSC